MGTKAHVSSKRTLFRNNSSNSELASPNSSLPTLTGPPPKKTTKNIKFSFKTTEISAESARKPGLLPKLLYDLSALMTGCPGAGRERAGAILHPPPCQPRTGGWACGQGSGTQPPPPPALTPVGAGSSKALSPFVKGIPWLKQPFRKRKA